MKHFILGLISIILIGCSDNKTTYHDGENYFSQQWYLQKDEQFYAKHGIDDNAHIHISDEVLNSYSGKGIKVAVIDDGFDINHPELKDKIIATVAFDNYGNRSNDVSHNGDEYHGTAVAGLIASSIKLQGIASNVELILIKMPIDFDDIHIELVFDVALEYGAQIINCSWGTNMVAPATREYINSIAQEANEAKGVHIVFAAGNFDELIDNDESSIKEVIAVGATNGSNLRSSSYSNYGPQLDITAPGGEYIGLTTLDPTDDKGATNSDYNELNFVGTSASAPIISGVIALLLESNSNLTLEQVREKLYTTTDLVGENTPYLDELIEGTNYPIISGLLGRSQNDSFFIRLTNKTTLQTYENGITTIHGDNSFSSSFSEEIPNGEYTVELISDSNFVFATDVNFTISNQFTNRLVDTTKRHSDFYGKGKVNVTKLFEK